MFDAQLLIQGSTVYSPWFPRGGDSIIATAELTAVSGATLVVEVFTKKTEETGDGVNADSGSTTKISLAPADAGKRKSTQWDSKVLTPGINELVRYKFAVTGTGTDWALFRMLEPVWYDSVEVA